MSADLEREKRVVAEVAAERVQSGMALGIGSGSTVAHFVRALGARVRAGLDVVAIAASLASERLARAEGIALTTFAATPHLDLTIDGADEVDPALRLVKGGGGALLREKVIAFAAAKTVIIVDSSKPVTTLGRFPLPLEALPFASDLVLARVAELGCAPRRRMVDGRPYLTDQGNEIIDCAFGTITAPEALARALDAIPGVLEHGLFPTEATEVMVARGDRVEVLRRAEK